MGIREEFENLHEIKRKLISVNFNKNLNRYESKNPTLIECFETALWLNGAWYAFQEQQKKIDSIVSIVREADLSDGNSSVAIVHDEIQELLK